MVIVRPTKPVPEQFECEPTDANLKDAHLIRPCERYMELYRSCKSILSRIHQYYVYGETLDCSPHVNNYNACLSFRKSKDVSLLDTIISWEKDFINIRMKTVEQNKAWKMRETPPADFDGPLPEFIVKRNRNSIFNSRD